MEDKVVCTKGWNWGYYQLDKENMVFNVNNQKSFVINYKDIALSNATGKNEVALEFQQELDKSDKGDILCEMRFYVPNSELDSIKEEKKEQMEEKKKEKEEKKKTSDGEGEEPSEEEEEEEEEESIITPAQIFNEKIIKSAGIGEFAGEMIASLSELPMIIPRGKYSFQLYNSFAKLHGRTNDYKIQYKDINKGFLLPKPDDIHVAYVLHLKVPLRQGQTLHHFIALQFEKEKRLKVTLNLSPEQIKEQYDDRLQPEIEGPLYDVISKLFKELIKINILIPSEFKSSKNHEAIKCSIKASDGYLYPLKSSLIFIHKPVIYIKYSEIKFIEFSRIGEVSSGMPSRSFDMTITTLKNDAATTFAGIDKGEHKNLMNYLKSKNIKMRSVDVETNQQIDFGDEDEDEEDLGEEEVKKGATGLGKRVRKPVKDVQMLDDEYDSEEDESFKDEASPQPSDDEEEEDYDEEDDDVSMVESDLEDEVKQLQKEVPKVSGKRGQRGGDESDKKEKKEKKNSSDEDQSQEKQDLIKVQQPQILETQVDLAPEVNVLDLQLQKLSNDANKFALTNQLITKNNHLNGVIEQIHIDEGKFADQYHNFENFGYALNPSDNAGKGLVYSNYVNKVDLNSGVENLQSKERKQYRKELKRKRQSQGDPSTGEFMGPWAIYDGMEQFKTQKADLTEDQRELMQRYEEMRKERVEEAKPKEAKDTEVHKATTVFHGVGADYGQNRSFIDHPSYLRPKEHACFIPKKWLHTWVGHNKGVQKIEFFPKYGHLMLSASHDSTIKIWDVMTHRKCLRTYMGHTKAVRDICFSNDGRRFLSAGFDRVVQLWDTETGKVIRSFTNKKTPFCVKFHPQDDKQNIFLAGCANKKILQYDTNSSEITQQYEEHLGAINTITFIEGGRRFVSTADDKKIFLWEFGIPVVAKHISEPDMQAIPYATMHPNGKYFAGQSMDNKIVIYDCKGNFKMNRKKKFTGHLNSGYACGLDFSPDGQFLASGDGDGKLWFWNWKTGKNLRTMKVHEGVCIDTKWHPIEPSKVATCGWDDKKGKRQRVNKKVKKQVERMEELEKEQSAYKKHYHHNEDALLNLQASASQLLKEMNGEPIHNQQQQDKQCCSDEEMDDYDKEVVDDFKKSIVGGSQRKITVEMSFDDYMKLIDRGNHFGLEPSFLKVSSKDYDFIRKKQLKKEKKKEKKEKKKEEKKRKHQQQEEEKETPTRKPANEEPLDDYQFRKDVQELMKTFRNFDKDVIEDILREKGNYDDAYEALCELESQIVHEQEEDIISQFQDIDSDYIQDDLMQQKLNQDIERDRLLAEKIYQEEEEEEEEEKNEDIAKALGINQEELTNMRIQEKLREFLFNFRFEEKMKKLQGKKNVSQKEQQMKKIKKLKASEQPVFKKFLDQLSVECFELLMLKHQQVQESANNPEMGTNSGIKVSPQKQEWREEQKKPIVQIHNTKEFPSLVDEKVIQREVEKRMRAYKMEMHKDEGFQQIHKNFKANTSEQLQKLIQTSNSFITLDHQLIQEAYDLLNDAELVYILLQMAFPTLHKAQDTSKIDKIFQNLDKLSNHKKCKKQAGANGKLQGNGFFTAEILKQFRYQNYQRQSANMVQDVYDESRQKAKQIYAKRQHFLQEIKKAKKAGNHQQMEYAMKQAEQCTKEYEQAQQNGQLQIFSLKNGNIEMMDQYIDLHGMHLQEALKILSLRLNQIQVDLNRGSLQPNIDPKNHVLKIVCGRGIHSQGRAVLKFKVPKFLAEKNYEYYNFEQDGVVLVRFKKQ